MSTSGDVSHDPGAVRATHEWVQCADVQCRLRFPLPRDHGQPRRCPRCQGSLAGPNSARHPGTDPVHHAGAGPTRHTSAAPTRHTGADPKRHTGAAATRHTGAGPTAIGASAGSAREPHDQAAPTVEVVALLDNIRSARNVGAMLRTSDAMGIGHLHLAGFTSPGDHPGVAKTALGAQDTVAWSSHPDGAAHARRLQVDGWEVWALEEGAGGQSLTAACASLAGRSARIVVVVGHEVAGIDPAILAMADRRVAIPMRGTKRSLNVATAFGIAAYSVTTPPSDRTA